jgi:hypothetical protein
MRTSSPVASTQLNFGVVPLRRFNTKRHDSSSMKALGGRYPCAAAPFGSRQTCARAMASSRASRDTSRVVAGRSGSVFVATGGGGGSDERTMRPEATWPHRAPAEPQP